jgi:uncharacterized protein (DUF302 family)
MARLLGRWSLALVLPLAVLLARPSGAAGVDESVVEVPLAQGVSIDDAISSMKLRASLLNLKLVTQQPLSRQAAMLGVTNVRRLEIYQFCNPITAYDMVQFDLAYAAYLPCRIAVVEDKKGRGWLVMLDPKRLLSPHMPAGLRGRAQKVIDELQQIVRAGASGAL